MLELDGILRLRDFLGLGQELEHTLRRGGGLLQHVGDIGDLGDGLRERAHVLDKGLDIAHGDGVADGQAATQDGDGYIPQVTDKVHDRHHQTRQKLGFPGGAVERVIQSIKVCHTPGLPVEGLHHQVPTKHLLHMAIDVPQVILLLFEVFL
jgi:hypothetical protein